MHTTTLIAISIRIIAAIHTITPHCSSSIAPLVSGAVRVRAAGLEDSGVNFGGGDLEGAGDGDETEGDEELHVDLS